MIPRDQGSISTTMKKFQDLDTFTERDVEDALRRNADDEISLVPLTIALVATDCAYAQQVCLKLAADPRPMVRGNALASLGHLARRFRSLDEAVGHDRSSKPGLSIPMNMCGFRQNLQLMRSISSSDGPFKTTSMESDLSVISSCVLS